MTDKKEYVDFQPIEESWSKYRLPDGTILEVKLVLTNLWIGEFYQKNEPHYLFEFGTVARVNKVESQKVLS